MQPRLNAIGVTAMLRYCVMIIATWAILCAAGCTTKPVKRPGVRGAPATAKPADPVQSDIAPAAVPPAPPPPTATEDSCIALPAGQSRLPFFVPGFGVMITRMLKTCQTDDGRAGYAPDTAWMAMGLPCTGGGGRLEWKPNYYAPKIVSFSVSTECPTMPATAAEVQKIGQLALRLSASARLMAFTPMTVQYYEIDEFNEVNTGSLVEFRESVSLSKGWTNFKNNVPVRVRMYGRENVWGDGDQLYVFEADIVQAAKATFRLNLVSARALSDDEAKALKDKCNALTPRRNCQELF